MKQEPIREIWMRIPVVDFLAWKLIQFTGLIQGLFWDLLTPKHGDVISKAKYIQRSESGRYLSKVNPEDLPTEMRQRLLNLGRFLLLLTVVLTLIDVC